MAFPQVNANSDKTDECSPRAGVRDPHHLPPDTTGVPLMWVRDEARPTPYKGQTFRSALEAKVAEQLDTLGVDWEYETKAHEAVAWFAPSYAPEPPVFTGYLPDFAIRDASEDLQLPLWVEVKPAGLLYAVRDHFGVSERFTDDVECRISAAELRAVGLDEIWKPKSLAEFYGRDVLVVYQVNATRSLSVLMRPDRLVLSRRHPAVNFRQVLAAAEKAEREAQWRAEMAEREAQWRVQQEAETARRQAQNATLLATWLPHMRLNGRPAKWPGQCLMCGVRQQPAEILIAQDQAGAWRSLCRSHLTG